MTKRAYVLMGLIGIGAVLTAIGISLGEPTSVMNKAITVCLECVGIG